MAPLSDKDFWKTKWISGDIAFHQPRVEPLLVQYFASIPPGKVLVPLCGKTLDMIWLRDHGWKITGVELVAEACEAFFKENAIDYRIETHGEFSIYRSPSIDLWCGDFFKLPAEVIAACTAVYDRAALIALPAPLRAKYMAHLSAHATPGVTMLMLAVEYPQENFPGPPFSVPWAEIKTGYATRWDISEIHRLDNQTQGGRPVTRTAYRLTKHPPNAVENSLNQP